MTAETPSGAFSNVSLEMRAWNIRRKALLMGEVQGQGYIGQALGVADVLATSYFHAMDHRPEDPEWDGRDRFLLSIGHYAIALYAALMEAGILPEDKLETYGMDDSRMPMSGMASYTPGMEISAAAASAESGTERCELVVFRPLQGVGLMCMHLATRSQSLVLRPDTSDRFRLR